MNSRFSTCKRSLSVKSGVRPIEGELAAVRMGRFLEPEEIAPTISFLVGPGGDADVGQVLSPNGGTVFPG